MQSTQFNGNTDYSFKYVNQYKRLDKPSYFMLGVTLLLMIFFYIFTGVINYFVLAAFIFILILITIIHRTKRYKVVKDIRYESNRFKYEYISFTPYDVDTIKVDTRESMFSGAMNGVYKKGKDVTVYTLVFKNNYEFRYLCKKLVLSKDEFPEVEDIVTYLIRNNERIQLR